MPPRRGLALLVCIGTLGGLALLSSAFLLLVQSERRAARSRGHQVQAWLVARSGLEDALARTAGGQDPDAAGNRFGGGDWDADGRLSPREADSAPLGRGGLPEVDACPARLALRPSFFSRDGAFPALRRVAGRERGVSGRLGYALRISPQGGFHLNGGDPAVPPGYGGVPPGRDANAVLRRMLGILADAVDAEDGAADALPVCREDGERLVDRRPARGWRDFGEVRDLALGGSREKLRALRPFLTLEAWVDLKVVMPSAREERIGSSYASWGEMKLDREEARPGSRAPDFERIAGRVVGRAPVDLAWARTRRPALLALLTGLRGVWLDERQATPCLPAGPSADRIGVIRAVEITPAEAAEVAGALLGTAEPLDSWERWESFCDRLPFPGAPLLEARAKRDLLKVQFNPNTDLNDFNPNPSRWRLLDKSDLLVRSTELSLRPLRGLEVESAGCLVDPSGRLLAERTLRMRLPPPPAVRLTAQSEFVCADLGRQELAGDESGPRPPGKYLSRSRGAGVVTWGQGRPEGAGRGFGLQTYPEPYADVDGPGPAPLGIAPASWDGAVQLSTVETPPEPSAYYGAPSPTQDLKMLARYDDGLDLEEGTDAARENRTDALQVGASEAGLSLLDPGKPNTLYPDGCYSEKGRAPAYLDRGNAHPFRGLLSFWVKPNYEEIGTEFIDQATRTVIRRRGHQYVKWSHFTHAVSDPNGPDQFFFLGELPPNGFVERAFLCQFETGHVPVEVDGPGDPRGGGGAAVSSREHRYERVYWKVRGHRWYLVTQFWDFQSPSDADGMAGRMVVDDGAPSPDVRFDWGSRDVYGNANDPASADDITRDDLFGPHEICLGRRGCLTEYGVGEVVGLGADATFDEFALYDFGPAFPGPGAAPEFAVARFREGRYYKGWQYRPVDLSGGPVDEEAGSLVTAPLSGGGFLRRIDWTCFRARPDEGVALDLLHPSDPQYLGSPEASQSRKDPARSPERQTWDLRRFVPGPFRLRISLLREGPVDADDPLLDSPVLDDLTLVWDPPGGPVPSAWEPD